MYANRFVAALKVNGEILRETNESVILPFGAEYSILLKNLNSVKSQISVSIDGKDVAGTLVIDANRELELERYIRDGNMKSGNRFKFIEMSSDIEKHRGNKAEDGLIRVEYKFALPKPEVKTVIERTEYQHEPYWIPTRPIWPRSYTPHPWYGDRRRHPMRGMTTRSLSRSPQASGGIGTMNSARATLGNVSEATASMNTTALGITVAGSESSQQFHFVPNFATQEQSHVIVLRLMGRIGKEPVTAAKTVSSKPVCSTCGKTNKSNVSFCGKCGTALQLI